MTNDNFIKSSGNPFKDMGFNEVEAKNLKLRSHLMNALIRYIQQEKLTQKKAAECLGVTQPRVSSLMSGKIDLFSTGMLLDMLEQVGFPIYHQIELDVDQFFRQYEKNHSDDSSSGRAGL